MENNVKFENYVPHCIDAFLHSIYLIKDCLNRRQYHEANMHVSDILADVQNEIDWCHRTDPVLGYMRNFLMQVFVAVNTLKNVVPSYVKEPLAEVIKVLEDTQAELAIMAKDLPRWSKPESSIDALEKEHRIRTYGLKQ